VLTDRWKNICSPTNMDLRNLQKYVGSTEQHKLENRFEKLPIGKPANKLNACLKEMLM
jgi:hypothetical protein